MNDMKTPIDQTVPTWMMKRQSTPRNSGIPIADAHRIILDEKHKETVSGQGEIDPDFLYNQPQSNQRRKRSQPNGPSQMRRNVSPAKAIADENMAMAESKKYSLVDKNR